MKSKIILNSILTILAITFLGLDLIMGKQKSKLIQENFIIGKEIETAKQSKWMVEWFEKKGGKEEIEKKEKQVEEILPLGSDVLNIVKELSKLAESLDISKIEFELQKEINLSKKSSGSQTNIPQSGIGGTPPSSFPKSSGGSNIKRVSLYKSPILIKFEGSYSQISKFIIQVQNFKRLLTVEKLEIKHSNRDSLSASLIINTYYFLPQAS